MVVSSGLMLLAQLTIATPESAGMSSVKLERAAALLAKSGVESASIIVVRKQKIVLHRGFGKAKADTPFLLASITKPVTAAALMLLVERGLVSLQDPVHIHIKEFRGKDREGTKVRDLLAHTSGLPDMLPENVELRARHAPLSEFVKGAATTPLLFAPGTDFSYQSMGVLLAAEIVERITGQRLRDFEKKEIFDPLGMSSTFLGLMGRKVEDTALAQPASGQDPAEWRRFGWNSAYWRDLGAPWGGLHSNARDVAVLLETFLNGGIYNGRRVFSPTTVAAMIKDQNTGIKRPWGIGWGLSTSLVWAYFGDTVSAKTFGHSGATGTVAWADPEQQLITVILTTRPSGEDGGRLLRNVSNAVASSIEH